MELQDTTRREKRQTFFVAIALAAAVMLLAAPVVQAAIQKVQVTNTVPVKVKGQPIAVKGTVNSKIKDSTGDAINSEVIGPMGLTGVPGSDGAMDVRIYAGGTGVLGVGDCTAAAAAGTDPSNVVTVPGNRVVTALIITGVGEVQLTSAATGAIVLNRFNVDAGTPNYSLSLPNGLGTTAPLTFTGQDDGGANCQYTVLGEDLHTTP
jgi:hypothetical protein